MAIPILALTVAAALSAAGRSVAQEAPAKPSRIVSMNLCADELVLRLADRGQVAAVSFLARDPRGSTVTTEAADVPLVRGLAEEIVGLRPDLVIAGAFTTRSTVALLKRIGFPPLELGSPGDFDAMGDQIRTVARAIGAPERGEAMIAAFQTRMRAAQPAEPSGLRALVMRPNAQTVSPGSFGDAILKAAGLVNVAAEFGRGAADQVPLEIAALARADLVVLDEEERAAPSLADALLQHPILRALHAQGRTVSIPNRLWTCPGPQAA